MIEKKHERIFESEKSSGEILGCFFLNIELLKTGTFLEIVQQKKRKKNQIKIRNLENKNDGAHKSKYTFIFL